MAGLIASPRVQPTTPPCRGGTALTRGGRWSRSRDLRVRFGLGLPSLGDEVLDDRAGGSKTQLFFERPQAGLRVAKLCRGLPAFGGFFVAPLVLAAFGQDVEKLGAAIWGGHECRQGDYRAGHAQWTGGCACFAERGSWLLAIFLGLLFFLRRTTMLEGNRPEVEMVAYEHRRVP